MKPDTPGGFYLCGLVSAVFCVGTVAMQLSMDPLPGESGERLAVRGLAVLLVPLSAVVTEALWRARPWAFRASLALALVYAATLAAAAMATRHTPIQESVVMWTIVSAVAVIPMLGYIHTQSAQLWPRGRVAVPAARP
jgi:hypothetical protein